MAKGDRTFRVRIEWPFVGADDEVEDIVVPAGADPDDRCAAHIDAMLLNRIGGSWEELDESETGA